MGVENYYVLGGVRHFGAQGVRRGAGDIVSPCAQLVIYSDN